MKTKQIRVNVQLNGYNSLKQEAKDLNMSLLDLAGLKLSGYEIRKRTDEGLQ